MGLNEVTEQINNQSIINMENHQLSVVEMSQRLDDIKRFYRDWADAQDNLKYFKEELKQTNDVILNLTSKYQVAMEDVEKWKGKYTRVKSDLNCSLSRERTIKAENDRMSIKMGDIGVNLQAKIECLNKTIEVQDTIIGKKDDEIEELVNDVNRLESEYDEKIDVIENLNNDVESMSNRYEDVIVGLNDKTKEISDLKKSLHNMTKKYNDVNNLLHNKHKQKRRSANVKYTMDITEIFNIMTTHCETYNLQKITKTQIRNLLCECNIQDWYDINCVFISHSQDIEIYGQRFIQTSVVGDEIEINDGSQWNLYKAFNEHSLEHLRNREYYEMWLDDNGRPI